MKRHNIYLNNYKYICDVFNVIDDKTELLGYTNNYVMFRRNEMINNVFYDTDLYFVERDLVEDFINSGFKNKLLWPIKESNSSIKFSNNYEKYNANITWESATNDILGSSDIYKIYEDELGTKEADILCDKIRIYHPASSKLLNCIVYVENFVSDIHCHYYCKVLNSIETNSETVFKVNNESYSEYSEFYIPNCANLFTKYFYENLNIMKRKSKSNTNDDLYVPINYIQTEDDEYIEKPILIKYLLEPFQIEIEDISTNLHSKIYIDKNESILFGQIIVEYPFNVILYSYSNIIDNEYTLSDNGQNSITYKPEYIIKLKSSIDFSKKTGIINLQNIFTYTNSRGNIKFKNIQEAYLVYNNVKLEDYLNYYDDVDNEMYDIGEDIPLIGFNIRIYDNINTYHLLYENNVSFLTSKNNTVENNVIIDDFEFPLTEIFSSWDQLPEKLYIQAVFIDKYLGQRVYGNYVTITKEQFKYFINDTDKYRINLMEKFNNGDINFIDKINCVVVKENDDNVITNTGTVYKPSKIIYQPIFYKVQQLNTIKIRKSVTQNIGINLSQYMTKVETFKLNIDGNVISEYARNDIYVLFSISGTTIYNSSGEYDITNQDDEYISSGQWSLY